MVKLKIGYFADGPWSYNALEQLLADESIEVVFIVPRTDSTDEVLRTYAEHHEIHYFQGYNVNSSEFLELVQPLQCDLFVSMSFNQIFKTRIATLPKFKTINCHAGKLPFYRGRNILNWALINDEKEFGITVHFVDEGIDTGDIILQRSYPISDADTYKTLLQVAYVECASILYDAIKMIQNDAITVVKQSDVHPFGFYCGVRSTGDEIINWNQPSRRIFNFIRAISLPGPQATTFLGDRIVRINSCKYIPEAPVYINTIGQIVGKTKDGFLVKTQDTVVEIREIETDIKLKVGDKFKI